MFVLGANEYLERLEGKIRKCLFFYVKIFENNSVYLLIFYRGNLKEPGEKECVLIIDRHTGEITLEKLSGHMLLKKTRQATKQSAQIKSLVNNSGTIKIFI